MPRGDLIELRAGSAAQWDTADPVLAHGEPGVAIDGASIVFKVGNGVDSWADLPIANAVALSEFLGTVANQAAMLALSGNRGDWAIRSDESATYVLTAEPASSLANWQKLPVPTDVVTSVNGRVGAVTGLAEQSALTTEATSRASADTALDTAKAPKADPTGTGVATWPAFAVAGLTGAVTPARFVGGTASGPPTSGTFIAGDFVVAVDGIMWICTAGGSPGTWADASSSGHEVDAKQSTTVQTGITSATDITGLTGLTIPNMVKPVWVIALTSFTFPVTATMIASLQITDNSNVVKSMSSIGFHSTTLTGNSMTCVERIAPGSGTQTRKARLARVSASGTISNGFDSTTLSTLRAIVA